MNKFIFLAVIILILIILYFNSNKINLYKKNINCGIIQNKQYIDDNYTQRVEKNLYNLLNKYSANKQINLKSKDKKSFISSTMPMDTKLEITMIVNKILKRINKNSMFNFVLIEIVDVDVIKKNKKRQYITNFLITDSKNYFNLRLYLNVIVYLKGNFKERSKKCLSYTTPPFPTYPIGIPSKDQLIPIPTDVIETQRNHLSNKCIYEIKSEDISYLYINKINILNNTDVVDYYEINKYKNIGGITDIKLEYNDLQNKNNNPFIESSSIRNKWPILKDEPVNQGQWPCQPNPIYWNTLGVSPTPVISTEECPGERYSTEAMPLQAQYWPTFGTLPRAKGQYTWFFNKNREIPNFPIN